MDVADLVRHYPRLYHMAEDDSWPSIRAYGLLSTSALLDLFEVRGRARTAIESAHRPENVTIEHPLYGTAVVRDQKPMREGSLAACLQDGMAVREWYRLLNGMVFFWPTEARLSRLLGARPYREIAHTVLAIDTATLLADHADDIMLSPINSGSTIYNAAPRGHDTFRPVAAYPFEERRRLRGAENVVAEVAVRQGVPRIADYVVRVDRRRADRVLAVLHRR